MGGGGRGEGGGDEEVGGSGFLQLRSRRRRQESGRDKQREACMAIEAKETAHDEPFWGSKSREQTKRQTCEQENINFRIYSRKWKLIIPPTVFCSILLGPQCSAGPPRAQRSPSLSPK